MTLILSRYDVTGLVTMAEVIDVIETAHADMARGTAAQPAPATLSLPSSPALFLAMAALADRQQLASVKLLADIPANAAAGLAVQRSMVMLVSQTNGACEAIIHGQVPTRMRTAAASAVATRWLARKDARVLGLIGAGALAEEHIGAMRAVRDIDRVLVWSRNPARSAGLAERAEHMFPGLHASAVASPREAVIHSDIVCTLTPSREPIVEGSWFVPGQHINAVGAPPRPDHREIDSAGMARARLVMDSVATALHESGEVLMALADGAIDRDDVRTELGQVIVGAAPGRTGDTDITLFNSVGVALQDLAIGSLLVERARQAGVGLDLDLSA